MRNSSRSRRRIVCGFLALLAIQMSTQILIASGDGDYPRAIREGGLMPNMLSVPTGQIGDPITLVILVIADDRLLHIVTTPAWQKWCSNCSTTDQFTVDVSSAILLSPTSPFLERQFQSLRGRNIRPAIVFILVEASDKSALSIERAKFR